jgi:hypothetical protein
LRAKNAAVMAEQQKEKTKPLNIGWIRSLLWGLSIVALLFVIYQLIAGRNIFSRTKALETVQKPEQDKHKQQHLPSQIEAAIQRKEYRLATRLLFLDALQQLAGNGHLHLMQEKTNYQYLNEIQDEGRKAAFATCLMHFEYTWYGEFVPNEKQFDAIHQSFVVLHQQWI